MIIDIIFIAFFVVCIFLGAKKGFAKTVVGLCTYIVSIVLGTIFFEPFKNAVYDFEPTAKYVEKFQLSVQAAMQSHIPTDNLPVFIKSSVRNLGDDVVLGISDMVVEAVLAIAFIIVLIAVVKLCTVLLEKIVKLPGLKQFNGFMGAAVGALNGVIVCYVLAAIMIFALTGNETGNLNKQISESVLAAYFYENNVILNILVGM